jgi:hypothetical protein
MEGYWNGIPSRNTIESHGLFGTLILTLSRPDLLDQIDATFRIFFGPWRTENQEKF